MATGKEFQSVDAVTLKDQFLANVEQALYGTCNSVGFDDQSNQVGISGAWANRS